MAPLELSELGAVSWTRASRALVRTRSNPAESVEVVHWRQNRATDSLRPSVRARNGDCQARETELLREAARLQR
jgi:hypothetical protein